MIAGEPTLVLQPRKSRLCGQSVVAMVLGIALPEACEVVGHCHGTRTRELVRVLHDRGVDLDDHAAVLRPGAKLPPRAILKVRAPAAWPSWGHWALIWDDHIYDSAFGMDPVYPLLHDGGGEPVGARITSYLTIRGRR